MMKRITCTLAMVALTLGIIAVTVPTAAAQITSSVANVSISASLPESLTVSTDVGSVSLNLVSAGVSNVQTVNVTSSWVLNPSRANVTLYGYFSSTDALSDGGAPANFITTSNVLAQVNGGGFAAFTQSNPVGPAGASLLLFNEAITGANKKKTRADAVGLEVDLTSVPQAPAGTYTGTLHIQARAL